MELLNFRAVIYASHLDGSLAARGSDLNPFVSLRKNHNLFF